MNQNLTKETKKRHIFKIRDGKFILQQEDNVKPKIEPDKAIWTGLNIASELGFVIVLPLIGGILAGLWLDKKFSVYPTLTLSFLFLGIILSFSNLFIIVSRFTKKK